MDLKAYGALGMGVAALGFTILAQDEEIQDAIGDTKTVKATIGAAIIGCFSLKFLRSRNHTISASILISLAIGSFSAIIYDELAQKLVCALSITLLGTAFKCIRQFKMYALQNKRTS